MSAQRPLRVTQVAPSDTGGGAERVAADLHRSALARGIDSHEAVGFRYGDAPGTIKIPNDASRSRWARSLLQLLPALPALPARPSSASLIVRRGLKVLAEPGRAWLRMRGYEDFDYPATPALPVIGGEPADVLHLHNLHSGYFDLRCLPRLSAQVPTVVTMHDAWLTTGHCAYTLECERWREGCGSCPHLDTYPAVPVDRTAENWQRKRAILSDSRLHVVGPSQWVLEKAADSILAAGAIDMRLIPNGVDQRVFTRGDKLAARRALGLSSEPLMLVFSSAARHSLYKDVHTLAQALPSIVERLSPRPVLLVSLGAWVKDAGIPGAEIISVPYLQNPSDVARYLQAADLMLHAVHAENHPLAILEAQSCALPVVASDVGGIPETLVDGRTGHLVAPDDSVALADAASALLLDEGRRESMSAAAFEHASGRFALDRMVDDYVELYRELAGRS